MENKIKEEFLSDIKLILVENIISKYVDIEIMKNTISECIKDISKKLDAQLLSILKSDNKQSNPNDFNNKLNSDIIDSINSKIYLSSRLNLKIINGNSTPIKSIVEKFSDEYFIK